MTGRPNCQFLNWRLFLPFLVLYLEGSRGINVALILFILLNNNQASNDLHTYKDRNETSATFTSDHSYVGTRKQVPDITHNYELQKNAVYENEAQHVNFRGNLLYQATKRHLNIS